MESRAIPPPLAEKWIGNPVIHTVDISNQSIQYQYNYLYWYAVSVSVWVCPVSLVVRILPLVLVLVRLKSSCISISKISVLFTDTLHWIRVCNNGKNCMYRYRLQSSEGMNIWTYIEYWLASQMSISIGILVSLWILRTYDYFRFRGPISPPPFTAAERVKISIFLWLLSSTDMCPNFFLVTFRQGRRLRFGMLTVLTNLRSTKVLW